MNKTKPILEQEKTGWLRRIEPNKPAQGHTPGPWFVTRGNEIGHDYTDANGDRHVGYIAETLHRGEQGEANARLIAAAPDLLAACKMSLLRFGAMEHMGQKLHPFVYETVAALKDAIAKAEGRAQ